MNVCILSKFPPIEGGIAAKSYWLARGYAEAGLSVQVVSNGNIVEDEYRIKGCYPHIRGMKGIALHEVTDDFPWHIPDEQHSIARLIDRLIEVHHAAPIDIVDAGYMVPYGIAAYFFHCISGVPYIIRHGGSDIEKFLNAGRLGNLLKKVLHGASTIVSDPSRSETFSEFEGKVRILPPYVPDERVFHPREREDRSIPGLLFMGKLNWYWERKGLARIIECLDVLPESWKPQFIGQGKGEEGFSAFLREKGVGDVVIGPFVPPWEVPEVLNGSDFVFCLSIDEPIQSFSNLLVEAACCGATIIVDRNFDSSPYQLLSNSVEDCLLRVPCENPDTMAEEIVRSWDGRTKNRSARNIQFTPLFEEYIRKNINILEQASK